MASSGLFVFLYIAHLTSFVRYGQEDDWLLCHNYCHISSMAVGGNIPDAA
jgi:predicted nucleic acid-binding Zn finger protein